MTAQKFTATVTRTVEFTFTDIQADVAASYLLDYIEDGGYEDEDDEGTQDAIEFEELPRVIEEASGYDVDDMDNETRAALADMILAQLL